MARHIFLSGLAILVTMLIAGLIFSGPPESITRAASDLKQNLDNKLRPAMDHYLEGDEDFHSIPSPVDSGSKAFCKWEFSHYESSPYEVEWFSLVPQAQDHICQTVAETKHAEISRQIVRRVKELYDIDRQVKWRKADAVLPTDGHDADQYMSRMHYKRSCYNAETRTFRPASGSGIQLIEPLWGMLRDPFDSWCGSHRLTMPGWVNSDGQSKQHIIPQGYAPYWYDESVPAGEVGQGQWRSHGIPPWHSSYVVEHDTELGVVYTKPKNIHLDLGASYFAGWTMHGGGGINSAASGKWFYDTYHERGPKFDEFIAVEVEVLNDTIAYQQVPKDLVGKYNLMNIGLSMDRDDGLNTIDMIRRIVRPEDFFVFKLDIDTAPIEAPIIQSILDDDPAKGGASALIDELMFEHHVNYDPMNAAWFPAGHKRPKDRLVESYNLFRDLRRKGIRSHSWP